MRVVIAGGHGKIALLLERLLAGRGDQAVGLIRNPAHVADVQKAGAEAVVCDLEAASAEDVAVLLSGADAVVFAAGAGPGQQQRDILGRGRLQIADHRFGAGLLHIGDVSGVSDQPDGPITAPGQQALQQQRNLPVPARDHHTHAASLRTGITQQMAQRRTACRRHG